ncbi:MAG TPA: hypothetical protein [Caudoviricetes sp.]|nr:MAG TPA: hypothetical protein [Caudoviricetes sp.]DAY92156.1 MAG TPA: hypothetical protein [Caudoviricetes sp.]
MKELPAEEKHLGHILTFGMYGQWIVLTDI